MATETLTATESGQEMTVEEKITQLRELFADAPEVGRTALENVLNRLTSQASKTPPPPVESASRVGYNLNVLRGGEYFFMPSLSALRWLADDQNGQGS